mgnify:CR=1 FL=1
MPELLHIGIRRSGKRHTSCNGGVDVLNLVPDNYRHDKTNNQCVIHMGRFVFAFVFVFLGHDE